MSTTVVRGANTFLLCNRLPNPNMVVTIIFLKVLSICSYSFIEIKKVWWRLCSNTFFHERVMRFAKDRVFQGTKKLNTLLLEADALNSYGWSKSWKSIMSNKMLWHFILKTWVLSTFQRVQFNIILPNILTYNTTSFENLWKKKIITLNHVWIKN